VMRFMKVLPVPEGRYRRDLGIMTDRRRGDQGSAIMAALRHQMRAGCSLADQSRARLRP
jgi:hypothetical protein